MKILRILARLLGKRQKPEVKPVLDLDRLLVRRVPGNGRRGFQSRPVRGNAA
jgi:hypothetical protein